MWDINASALCAEACPTVGTARNYRRIAWQIRQPLLTEHPLEFRLDVALKRISTSASFWRRERRAPKLQHAIGPALASPANRSFVKRHNAGGSMFRMKTPEQLFLLLYAPFPCSVIGAFHRFPKTPAMYAYAKNMSSTYCSVLRASDMLA